MSTILALLLTLLAALAPIGGPTMAGLHRRCCCGGGGTPYCSGSPNALCSNSGEAGGAGFVVPLSASLGSYPPLPFSVNVTAQQIGTVTIDYAWSGSGVLEHVPPADGVSLGFYRATIEGTRTQDGSSAAAEASLEIQPYHLSGVGSLCGHAWSAGRRLLSFFRAFQGALDASTPVLDAGFSAYFLDGDVRLWTQSGLGTIPGPTSCNPDTSSGLGTIEASGDVGAFGASATWSRTRRNSTGTITAVAAGSFSIQGPFCVCAAGAPLAAIPLAPLRAPSPLETIALAAGKPRGGCGCNH